MSKQFERESPIDEVRILEEACMLAHQGDPRKLLELYHVHVSQSIRQMFSSNVTVDMTVDDLINDVAIRLARSNRPKRFDSVNMLRGYCVTVAKNVLKDKYRRSEREYRRLGSSFDDVGRHVDV